MARHLKQLTDLPKIISCMLLEGKPQFVIITYHDFVNLAAETDSYIPDVELIEHNDIRLFVALDVTSLCKFLDGFTFIGDIDEEKYNNAYGDVANAVKAGKIASARAHYVYTGYLERRSAELV